MAHSPSSQQLTDEKRALRRVLADRRDLLDERERVTCSQAATSRLLSLPIFSPAPAPAAGAATAGTVSASNGKTVAGFVAIRKEIDPGAALAAVRTRGAVVVLPRISEGGPRLRFHRVEANDALVPGPFGLVEPAAQAPEVAVADIDVMLVPGLAFDLAGRRVGYGGGYYDEVAARVRGVGHGVLVGLAYDFQIVDRCPAGEGDVAVDWIVTDRRSVVCEVRP